MNKSMVQLHRPLLCSIAVLVGLQLLYPQGYAQNPPPAAGDEQTTPDPNDLNNPDNPGPQGDDIQQSRGQNSGKPDYSALPVPFGLQWAQGPEEIIEWAAGRKFPTAWKEKAQAQGTESVLEVLPPAGVEQFPDAEFNDLNFAFKNGHLVEVKVIFRYTDQNEAQTQNITQKRKSLVEKDQNQQGDLIENSQKDQDGVHYQHHLWQWDRGSGLYIYLLEAEARKKQQSLISIVLTYRNQTLAAALPNRPR